MKGRKLTPAKPTSHVIQYKVRLRTNPPNLKNRAADRRHKKLVVSLPKLNLV